MGLVAACVLATVLYGASVFPLSFDTNDDVAMAGIARGLFHNELGDPRLIHQSAFLGLLIGSLFKLYAGFDWYSAFQWLVCLAGLIAIGFVWFRRSRSLLSVMSFLAIGSIFYAPILFHMQFTQTSLVCMTAAVVLMLDGFDSEGRFDRRHGFVIGLAILGTMIRSANQIVAQVVLVAAALYLASAMLWRGDGPKGVRRLGLNIALVLVFSLLSIGIKSLEARTFYDEPQWRDFWEHRVDRSYVMHNWPREIGQQRIASEIETELGISPEQYAAIMRWIPIDEESYSTPAFASMAEVIRRIESVQIGWPDRLSRSTRAFGAWLQSVPLLRHGLLFIVLLAVCHAIQSREIWGRMLATGLFWSSFLVVILFAIQLGYRAPPYRVWMPLLAMIATCSAYCHVLLASLQTRPGAAVSTNRIGPGLVVVLFLVGLKWIAPLHEDFRAFSEANTKRRAQECGLADLHLRAFDALPEGGKIFLATQVVKSHCIVTPMNLAYPDVLRERTITFGWRMLTPWSRDRLFAEESDLFDQICSDPRNVLVVNPMEMPIVDRYLARHKPEVRLSRFSSSMPPAILGCRVTPIADRASPETESRRDARS
jgi:hypothetical protein